MKLLWHSQKNKKVDISAPFNFQHQIHVEVNDDTGEICGLPRQWKSVFASSKDQLYKRGRLIVTEPVLHRNLSSITNLVLTSNGYTSPTRSQIVSHSRSQPECAVLPSNSKHTNTSDPTANGFKRAPVTPKEVRKHLLTIVNNTDPRNDLCNIKMLGRGSTGTVSHAYMSSKRRNVAVKRMVIKTQQRPELLINEVNVMNKCEHKNIVQMISAHVVDEELWILMEVATGGSLTSFLSQKRLTEVSIATISKQTLGALSYLHGVGVIHRDLKSDSILFTHDRIVKLSDFGFSCILTKEVSRRKSLLGTPYWLAPEVACREEYNTAIDIWSYGITVIEMVCGEPPFYEDEPVVAIQRIKSSSSPKIPDDFKISEELTDFLAQMLRIDPSQRWHAPQLLEHSFIEKALQDPTQIEI
ncbi:unnamed protein product [Bursaphelenchus okinawaensis]|uniref:non-specific serine/threonine protein kinase n=1 Tax=Bursaphelenchus okinawaensis TaxID=465554 RepID=A0A811LCQ0_9BILA|nr:unnamed protein product [Bursaphelenchus okinawaensis]CAG9120690.1 unnamed protein product [Bursaphelenchus okinawaensis]